MLLRGRSAAAARLLLRCGAAPPPPPCLLQLLPPSALGSCSPAPPPPWPPRGGAGRRSTLAAPLAEAEPPPPAAPAATLAHAHAGPAVDPFTFALDELNAVSERMRRAVAPALATAASYFLRHGVEGKRLRPAVLLLVASALAPAPPPPSASLVDASPPGEPPVGQRRRQQRVAEVAELIHVASLLHDDVIDGAATRRGLRALNLEMGNKLAILAGDFLLARASVTLASLREPDVIVLLSTVIEHLVTGEVMQMTARADELASFAHYEAKTHYKTASLVALSCKAVALLGLPGDAAAAEACYDYGRHLGLAFQYVDDVLDYTGSAGTLGKPALSDLRSGLATAPVLYAAQEQPWLVPLVQRRFRREGDVEAARAAVEASPGVARARALAAAHAARAVEALGRLPPAGCAHAAAARAGLAELTRRVLARTK